MSQRNVSVPALTIKIFSIIVKNNFLEAISSRSVAIPQIFENNQHRKKIYAKYVEQKNEAHKQQWHQQIKMRSNTCCHQKRLKLIYKKHQECLCSMAKCQFKCHTLSSFNNFFCFNSF